MRVMFDVITRIWHPARIIGHFDKNTSTYLIWQDRWGQIFCESIFVLAKKRNFWKRFSKKDIFLFGCLVGAEQEK